MIFGFKEFLDQDYKNFYENFNEKTMFSLRFEALKLWTFGFKEYLIKNFLQFLQVIPFFFYFNILKTRKNI